MSKEQWKNTGKELGGAFEELAKTVIRSAKVGVDKAEEWAERDENAPAQEPKAQAPESNVFNDGSWKETGKGLGKAFESLGKTLVGTGLDAADKAADKAEEWAEGNHTPKDGQQ